MSIARLCMLLAKYIHCVPARPGAIQDHAQYRHVCELSEDSEEEQAR